MRSSSVGFPDPSDLVDCGVRRPPSLAIVTGEEPDSGGSIPAWSDAVSIILWQAQASNCRSDSPHDIIMTPFRPDEALRVPFSHNVANTSCSVLSLIVGTGVEEVISHHTSQRNARAIRPRQREGPESGVGLQHTGLSAEHSISVCQPLAQGNTISLTYRISARSCAPQTMCLALL